MFNKRVYPDGIILIETRWRKTDFGHVGDKINKANKTGILRTKGRWPEGRGGKAGRKGSSVRPPAHVPGHHQPWPWRPQGLIRPEGPPQLCLGGPKK